MGTTLLWTLHLAFALLLLAATLASCHGRPAAARRALIALALMPLLAFHSLLVWRTASLRFGVGVAHAPWLATASLLALHLVGASVLLLRARRWPGAAAWPAGALALCAIMALAFDVTTLWNLQLAARLRVSDLRLEAGRIAWREGPPRPAPEDNAAPAYLSLAKSLEERLGDELDAWRSAEHGEQALADAGPSLKASLQAVAEELEAVRVATHLATCWFEPEEQQNGGEMAVSVPPIQPLITIADALALEARVLAADGRTEAALADVDALFLLSNQLAAMPLLIGVLCASVVRDEAVTTLSHVLVAGRLDASALERHELTALAGVVPRALAMEEAFGLSAVGLLARGEVDRLTNRSDAGRASRIDAAVYQLFLLEADVAGYRASMDELRALARVPLAELLATPEPDAREIHARGVLATLCVPNLRQLLVELHRVDARTELARLALRAAHHRLEHGRYPASLAELGVEAPGVSLEGDGSYVRLLRPDLRQGDREVELRLPPRVE